jgi:uncharacterized membrane protein YvlD (DUF360 family)
MRSVSVLVVLWWMFCAAMALFTAGLSIYGIYLAFCASVILGIVTLFVSPAGLTFGAVQVFLHTNLPVMIVQWISNH